MHRRIPAALNSDDGVDSTDGANDAADEVAVGQSKLCAFLPQPVLLLQMSIFDGLFI